MRGRSPSRWSSTTSTRASSSVAAAPVTTIFLASNCQFVGTDTGRQATNRARSPSRSRSTTSRTPSSCSVGPDPVADRVTVTGEKLRGSPITNGFICSEGLSNAGGGLRGAAGQRPHGHLRRTRRAVAIRAECAEEAGQAPAPSALLYGLDAAGAHGEGRPTEVAKGCAASDASAAPLSTARRATPATSHADMNVCSRRSRARPG